MNTHEITPLQTKIAADVRRVMEKKDLSQNAMAALLGVSPGAVSEILSHKRGYSDGVLSRISQVLRDFQPSADQLFTSVQQYQKMRHIASSARKEALFTLVTGNTGVGKTTTVRQIFAGQPHTFYIKIENEVTWRILLRKIAQAWGVHDVPRRYSMELLWEMLQSSVEKYKNQQPLLIIDEAEELSTGVFRKLKRLHTLTEGALGVLIVAHSSLKRRLARAAGLHAETEELREGREETLYTPLWRRLTKFTIPPVSYEDIETLSINELGVKDATMIEALQRRWTNYGYMAKDMLVAKSAGLEWQTMTPEELTFISKT